VCSRDVIADLFDVSRRTVGNAIVWVRPLLDQDGYTATHSAARYSSAAELLNAITGHENEQHTPESPR
jgi:transcriptional antiterminator